MELIEFFNQVKTPMTVAHVLSAVCAMGAALTSDVLFTFYSADRKLSRMEINTLAILSKIVWYGLLAVIITGIGIFASDTAYYLASAKFLAKMTITGILIINGFVLDRFVWPRLIRPEFFTVQRGAWNRKIAFICGAISVISWVSVLSLGVLDSVQSSYGTIMAVYDLILIIGIAGSLAIERIEYGNSRKKTE